MSELKDKAEELGELMEATNLTPLTEKLVKLSDVEVEIEKAKDSGFWGRAASRQSKDIEELQKEVKELKELLCEGRVYLNILVSDRAIELVEKFNKKLKQ